MKKFFFAVCVLVFLLFGILHITIGDQNHENPEDQAELQVYRNNSMEENENKARAGDPLATYYLSLKYLKGIAVAKDDTKAEYWLGKLGVNTRR
jgi:TPR repeat protein